MFPGPFEASVRKMLWLQLQSLELSQFSLHRDDIRDLDFYTLSSSKSRTFLGRGKNTASTVDNTARFSTWKQDFYFTFDV